MPTEIQMPDVIETLFWYDGPILFTAEFLGKVRLVTLLDLEDSPEGVTAIYMVSSPDPDMMTAMRENRLPLRDASNAGPLFRLASQCFADGKTTYEEVEAWPEGTLPEPGVLLSLETAG